MKKIMKKVVCAILSIFILSSSPAFSDGSCFKTPSNYDKTKVGGVENKEQTTRDQYAKQDAGAMAIFMCNAQLSLKGPHTIFKNCGCRQAIKKACSFRWDDGVLKVSGKNGATKAMCTPWIPIANLL